jgi:protocadherin alpha
VNLIFAVTQEQFDIYKQLKEHVEGSSAGILSEDSSNIVELVKAQYQVRGNSLASPDLPDYTLCYCRQSRLRLR